MASTMGKRPRKSFKGKIKAKIPAAVKSYVRKTVMNMAEAKQVVSGGIVQLDSAQTGQSPSALNLVPRIEQGAQQNQRTGNDVKVVSGLVRGHLNINIQNVTTNQFGGPVLVKMWLCRYKTANTSSILNTNADTAFFEGGAGGAIGFTGTIQDMTNFPNVDSWDVMSTKEYKLGLASPQASTPAIASYYDDSPSCVAFEFDLGKYLRGTTQYLDNTSSVSINKNLFLVFQATYAFNAITTTASELVTLTYNIRHQYIDAQNRLQS